MDPSRPITVIAPVPVPVAADEQGLQQLIHNLLANALVHTPAGTPVEVRVVKEGARARLRVKDQGPGMDAEQSKRVFDRFYRANGSNSGGGSGLGLFIVATVARTLGGYVTVDTAPGKGATFEVVLPVYGWGPIAPPPAEPPAAPSKGRAGTPASRAIRPISNLRPANRRRSSREPGAPVLSTVDTGSGPPVLLLHGQPGSKASWTPLIGLLAPRFRVLAPDRPGYGDTEGEAMDMAENADVVAEFLRSRDAAPATVVGHSWSGGVAILLAHRHPETVRSLVLVGAVGTPDSVNGLDRLMVVPGIGDLLTVGALTGIGVILPRTRQLVNRMSRTGSGSAAVSGAGPESSTDRHRRREVRRSKARSYMEVTLPNERMPGGWRASWGREPTDVHERTAGPSRRTPHRHSVCCPRSGSRPRWWPAAGMWWFLPVPPGA